MRAIWRWKRRWPLILGVVVGLMWTGYGLIETGDLEAEQGHALSVVQTAIVYAGLVVAAACGAGLIVGIVRDRRRYAHGYWPGWPALARATLQAHLEENGWQCPGWEVDAHPATDLMATYFERDQLGVLCRRCDARRELS